ncbi:MAG: DUF5919 domain-containing protein [bacterium]
MKKEKIFVVTTRICFLFGLFLLFIAGIVGLFLKEIPFLVNILLNLGMSLTTGSLLGMTWEIAIGKKSILEFLEFLCPLVRDLQRMGMERFYQIRRNIFMENWEKWKRLIINAKQIDIMGNNLRQNWASEEFIKLLEEKLKKKDCKFRFLLFDPNAEIAKQRESDEEGEEGILSNLVKDTLKRYKDIWNKLNDESKEFFKIKLVNRSNIYCYIVRIDDKMVIANYYRHVKGGGAPAMEIYDSNLFLFKFFSDEFEKMWEISKDWNWEL